MKQITIDGAKIHTKQELHEIFASMLNFPEWYGKNLDALHDCLTEIHEETVIHMEDFDDLERHLPLYARLVVRVVRHACRENSHLSCTVDRDDIDDDEKEED